MNNDYNSYYENARTGLTWQEYQTGTFRWMTIGLAVTFGLAYLTASVPSLFYLAYQLYLPLTIAELVMVAVLSAKVQTLKVSTARGLFFGYAALNGLVFSMYFVVFDVSTLMMAFLSAAIYFGLSAWYGARTEKDLTAWGPRLMIGLVAMIVCSLLGALFGFGFTGSLLYCGIGVLLFMLLTAYDTQKLQQFYEYYAADEEMAEKTSIYGALSLYLDFINIFLYLLRIFARRSNSNN